MAREPESNPLSASYNGTLFKSGLLNKRSVCCISLILLDRNDSLILLSFILSLVF